MTTAPAPIPTTGQAPQPLRAQSPVSAGAVEWPLHDRLRWCARFRRLVASQRDGLCRLVERDTGKPRWEALTGDVMPLLASCRWHEKRAAALLAPSKMRGKAFWQMGQSASAARRPAGSVAIIATWNYPLQLLGVQLVQALVAGDALRGNRVTVKPSERAPESQARLLELAIQAGLPDGALTSVPATRAAGEALLNENKFDHVVFTGSTEVGRAIARRLAETLTPSTLELSGRDSAFVLEGADPRTAARSVWFAATLNAGQTCMAPKRALVEPGVYGPFLRELGRCAAGGASLRLIDEAAADRVYQQALAACHLGARSLTGLLEEPEGRSIRPIALADCPPDTDAARGTNFGPLLAVVPVRSEAEALEIHNGCDQHLATSVFGSGDRAGALAAKLDTGLITINDAVLPAAHPGAAVTGRGESGWGASRGREGLLALTRPATITTTSSTIRTPLDPPAPQRASKLGAFAARVYGSGRAKD